MAGENALSRRTFLMSAGAGALSIWLPACVSSPPASRTVASETPRDFSPIDRTIAELTSNEFSGDAIPARAHELLWDKEGFLTRHPGMAASQSEEAPLVIIGGGMAGLTAAYLLRDLNPIVLEQAPRLGGNSRGEAWRGIDYSIGAAYFSVPADGTPLHQLLVNELGVQDFCVKRTEEDPVLFSGQLRSGFWSKGISAFQRLQVQKFRNYLKQVARSSYPALPATTPAEWKLVKRYDQQTLLENLEKAIGRIEDPLFTAIEHYCWSSFGASSLDLSAAAGLNFLISEFDDIYVAPGGNAAVAERLSQKLRGSAPGVSLRPDSLVFDVRPTDELTSVRYLDRASKMREIRAKAVVMACPKFVAGKLMEMEPKREAAIRKIHYRSYLVANVLCKGSTPTNFYDCFLMGTGRTDRTHIEDEARKQGATDMISSGFSQPKKSEFVLTLYRAFPYEGARSELLSTEAHARYRSEIEAQLQREIVPGLGEKSIQVQDIRLARWGHPMPVAAKGAYANGTVATLQAPFQNKIFFVEQDNWMLPCLESAMGEALRQAPAIRSAVVSRPT